METKKIVGDGERSGAAMKKPDRFVRMADKERAKQTWPLNGYEIN
jgi:hypothetical protein